MRNTFELPSRQRIEDVVVVIGELIKEYKTKLQDINLDSTSYDDHSWYFGISLSNSSIWMDGDKLTTYTETFEQALEYREKVMSILEEVSKWNLED